VEVITYIHTPDDLFKLRRLGRCCITIAPLYSNDVTKSDEARNPTDGDEVCTPPNYVPGPEKLEISSGYLLWISMAGRAERW
jgi:hypothetical protein